MQQQEVKVKKFVVEMRIETVSTVVLELEASNKRQARQRAKDLWAVYCGDITKADGKELELEPGATAVAFDQWFDQRIGDVEVHTMEEAAAAMEAAMAGGE
jgi:hypothetical protein